MAARTRRLSDPAAIAEAVAARREHLGMTQDEACALSDRGISKAVWSLIENARQDTYRTRSLDAVRSVLSWPRDWIERIEVEHEDLTEFVARPTGNVEPDPVRPELISRLAGHHNEESFRTIAHAIETAFADEPGRYVIHWDVVDGVPKSVLERVDDDPTGKIIQLERRIENLERRLAQLGRVVAEELQMEFDLMDDASNSPMIVVLSEDEAARPAEGDRP